MTSLSLLAGRTVSVTLTAFELLDNKICTNLRNLNKTEGSTPSNYERAGFSHKKFVCFDTLCLSQQFYSQFGLNQC